MNGLAMLFWAITYEAYNLVFNRGRRWEMDCPFCDETKCARSKNMALTKASLHVHCTDDNDHPDGPDDIDPEDDLEWDRWDIDPRLVDTSQEAIDQ